MKTANLILLIIMLIPCILYVPVKAANLFGSDVRNDKLITVNSSNLNVQVIGQLAPPDIFFAITGLAYDPTSGVLYGISPSDDMIYTINTLTGSATQWISVSTGGNPNGLAFDSNHHILYLTDNISNGLYSYNITSSEFGFIGPITGGFSNIEGLGYDPRTDTLYGLADTQDQIIKIDTISAAATGLSNSLGVGIWRGLDFDPESGMLYATRVNEYGQLTVVDPLTGKGIDLGTMTDNFSYVQGLAFIPEPSMLTLTLISTLIFCYRRKIL